jgi:hypothetical protein
MMAQASLPPKAVAPATMADETLLMLAWSVYVIPPYFG